MRKTLGLNEHAAAWSPTVEPAIDVSYRSDRIEANPVTLGASVWDDSPKRNTRRSISDYFSGAEMTEDFAL